MKIPEIVYSNGGYIELHGVNLNRGADITPVSTISSREGTIIIPAGTRVEEREPGEAAGQAEAPNLSNTAS